MIPDIVYLLCALTCFACTALLRRGYRRSRTRLLKWSAWCFVGLGLNNLLLFVDMRIVPQVDLSIIRSLPALAGLILLIYGLIWETH